MRYHLGKHTAQSDLETDTRKATMGSGAKTTDDEQKRKLRRRSKIKVILVFNAFFFFFNGVSGLGGGTLIETTCKYLS